MRVARVSPWVGVGSLLVEMAVAGCASQDGGGLPASGDDASSGGGHEAGGPGDAGFAGDGDGGSSGGGDAGGSGNGDAGGGGGGDSGNGGNPDSGPVGDGGPCTYTSDSQFCACIGGYDCGGATVADATKTNQTVFCGGCAGGAWCQPGALGVGIGHCGGQSPLVYPWQRQKIDMLVSMGENDNTVLDYGSCADIGDGRGFTIGQVGFCTGTGDFIVVAACYDDRKPGNALSKYWKALAAINDAFASTGQNQADTSGLTALGDFCGDVATAAKDPLFVQCQDDVGDAFYMASALQHAQDRGFEGLLTLGFLYDTELNFGEGDESNGLGGTATVMKRADADYGAGLPASFKGLPWEESRWLGFMIQERAVEMSGDKTWKSDVDQNATWEAARRLHTGKTSSPETGTDLGMAYDSTSAYKAGAKSAGAACWTDPPLKSTIDTQASIYVVGLDKSASATDPSKWVATGNAGSGSYQACPANPTP